MHADDILLSASVNCGGENTVMLKGRTRVNVFSSSREEKERSQRYRVNDSWHVTLLLNLMDLFTQNDLRLRNGTKFWVTKIYKVSLTFFCEGY